MEMEKRTLKKQQKINEKILDELEFGYSCEKKFIKGGQNRKN